MLCCGVIVLLTGEESAVGRGVKGPTAPPLRGLTTDRRGAALGRRGEGGRCHGMLALLRQRGGGFSVASAGQSNPMPATDSQRS
jgi:hypothetical protein